MIHLVQASLAVGRHSALVGAAFLVARLPLGALVTENLDLTIAPGVNGAAGIVPGVVIGVDLDVHGESLDTLLGAEVRAETLDGDVHLGGAVHRVPVHCQGVVAHLVDAA